MVLALNMMDEVRGNGGTVRINKMEAMLGIPVIPISACPLYTSPSQRGLSAQQTGGVKPSPYYLLTTAQS